MWPPNTAAVGGGGMNGSTAIRTVTANTTVTAADAAVLINSAAGPIVITLPAPATVLGQRFTFKKISADNNTVTIRGAMIEDDVAGVSVMAQYEAVAIVSDGNEYFVLYRG